MAEIVPSPRSPERTRMIDEVNTNLTYFGVAKLGTLTSEAKWQIFRIQKTGSITTIQYVNGSRRYNQVWDDHLSLTYSN